MHTLAELYFAAVLSGANGSAEGLGSVNLLRWGLCAGGSKGGVHWVEWSVWCARAFRGKVMPHQRAKRLSLFVVRLSGYLVGDFFFMGFPYSYRTGTFGLNQNFGYRNLWCSPVLLVLSGTVPRRFVSKLYHFSPLLLIFTEIGLQKGVGWFV